MTSDEDSAKGFPVFMQHVYPQCPCHAVIPPSREHQTLPRPNYWTIKDAHGDVELPECIHGMPRNIFCGKCEG